jgi:Family of unknown function (DUF6500)
VRTALRQKIIEVCDKKIEQKGTNVGLSFYAFFANKNDNPELLNDDAVVVAGFWEIGQCSL